MFSYKINQSDKMVTIQFTGDLDIEATEVIEEELIPAMKPFTNIEFDFSFVQFVDSTGIGLLLHMIETVKNNGKGTKVKINNILPLVKEVFEMLQLDEYWGRKLFHSIRKYVIEKNMKQSQRCVILTIAVIVSGEKPFEKGKLIEK